MNKKAPAGIYTHIYIYIYTIYIYDMRNTYNLFMHIRKYTSLYNQVIRAHVFIVKYTHYSRRITPLILPQGLLLEHI